MTRDWKAAEQLYHVVLASSILNLADIRVPHGVSTVEILYSRMELACPYDVNILEHVYLPRHKDTELQHIAQSTIARIRAKDSKLGIVKWKSEATGAIDFNVGQVCSFVEGGGAFAIIGWEWIEESEGAFSWAVSFAGGADAGFAGSSTLMYSTVRPRVSKAS